MQIKLHHLNLCSKNVAAMDEFYRAVLGLQPEPSLAPARVTTQGYAGNVAFVSDGNIQVHIAEKDLGVGFRTKNFVNPVERGHIAFRTDDIAAFKKRLKNVTPRFQQKLTEAVIKGAVVEEIVIADNLTSKQAYELEHRHMEEMVHDGKRGQLWNVVPPSIYTPQEYEAFLKKLLENSRSKNYLGRNLARMQLARLASHRKNASTFERGWPAGVATRSPG